MKDPVVYWVWVVVIILLGFLAQREIGDRHHQKVEAVRATLEGLAWDKDSTAQYLTGLDSAGYAPVVELLRHDARNYRALAEQVRGLSITAKE